MSYTVLETFMNAYRTLILPTVVIHLTWEYLRRGLIHCRVVCADNNITATGTREALRLSFLKNTALETLEINTTWNLASTLGANLRTAKQAMGMHCAHAGSITFAERSYLLTEINVGHRCRS